MVARTRVRDRYLPKGWWSFFGNPQGPGGHVRVGFDVCKDQVLPGDNHPFSVDKFDASGGVLNGNNYGLIHFYDYVADALFVPDNWAIHDILDSPSITQAATSAAARTNPSTPYVDVPVSLIELRELPSLYQTKGNDLLAQAGSEHLKYEFGAKPLIDDLAKLVDFQDQVDRRIKVLKRLATEREYRKTVRIWAGEQKSSHSKVMQSSGCFINSTFEVTTRKLIWAHCRWIPTVDFDPLMSSDAMRGLAKRAVLGLTLDFKTAWELMPWSWLIDWFGNFGEFLAAHRNHIPATLASVTVCTHTQSVHECGPAQDGGIHMSSVRIVRESKLRQTASVAPVAHFPFLNGRQVGILAALYATRR